MSKVICDSDWERYLWVGYDLTCMGCNKTVKKRALFEYHQEQLYEFFAGIKKNYIDEYDKCFYFYESFYDPAFKCECCRFKIIEDIEFTITKFNYIQNIGSKLKILL